MNVFGLRTHHCFAQLLSSVCIIGQKKKKKNPPAGGVLQAHGDFSEWASLVVKLLLIDRLVQKSQPTRKGWYKKATTMHCEKTYLHNPSVCLLNSEDTDRRLTT